MDTIAHSTMGDLVVGNYDLKPTVRGGLVSGNAFIYNMTRRQWTLLRLARKPVQRRPRCTASGRTAGRAARATPWLAAPQRSAAPGRCGDAAGLPDGTTTNGPASSESRSTTATATLRRLVTHFDGITAVPGRLSTSWPLARLQDASMAFVPVNGRTADPSALQRGIPSMSRQARCARAAAVNATGNTVYKNRVMGIYLKAVPRR